MANRDFNKLSIDEQVTFINNQLEKDKNLSLRKLCKKFGLSRTTIQSRFKNNHYEYDPYDRKYKSITKVVEKEKNINIDTMEEVAVAKVEKYKSNELIFLHEIEKKKNDLLELLELKEDIKRLIQNHDKNIINVEAVELKIDKTILKGDAVNRSVKMYGAVYKELQALYEMYPMFRRYDILSQAIHEFYLKYKKIK